MRSPIVIALLAGAAHAVPHPPEGKGDPNLDGDANEAGEPAKCAKCPLHNHEAAHPPPSGDSLGSLLGGGPPPILPYGAEAPVGNVDISTAPCDGAGSWEAQESAEAKSGRSCASLSKVVSLKSAAPAEASSQDAKGATPWPESILAPPWPGCGRHGLSMREDATV